MNEKPKEKSIKLNMVLNAIKGIMSVIFPIITFPYVTKILGVENVGKYNFSNSVISYFVLIAGLGISSYAAREGARIRDNRNDFSVLANQLFGINVLSTIFSYLLFFLCLITIPKLHQYTALLIILSIQILFKTLGIEWIYTIYEDFAYITIRSIVFQILALLLLFLCVKTADDLLVYGWITVFSSVGSNVLNFVHARKYCKIKLTGNLEIRKHIRPILILFATTAMVTIYVSADTTMLGFMCGDYTVGIYSVSTKIYGIVKTILASVMIVSVPRLASFLGKIDETREQFNTVASDIYSTLYSVLIPSLVGIMVLRKEIVLFISGVEYIEAVDSLTILALALFTCLGAYFWGQCILIPYRRDSDIFIATVISAVANISLNLLLIPVFKERAAAFTTLIAEGISFFWCWYKGRKYVQLKGTFAVLIKSIVGSASIVIVHLIIEKIFISNTLHLIITMIFSVIIYFLIEVMLRNTVIIGLANSGKKLVSKLKK